MRGELGRITECVRGGCYGSRIVSECCGLYCENPWYYRVCEDYNGVVSKVLGDGWLNPRILSVQSLEAHQRALHEPTYIDMAIPLGMLDTWAAPVPTGTQTFLPSCGSPLMHHRGREVSLLVATAPPWVGSMERRDLRLLLDDPFHAQNRRGGRHDLASSGADRPICVPT